MPHGAVNQSHGCRFATVAFCILDLGLSVAGLFVVADHFIDDEAKEFL